jgi:hypothetical protein
MTELGNKPRNAAVWIGVIIMPFRRDRDGRP